MHQKKTIMEYLDEIIPIRYRVGGDDSSRGLFSIDEIDLIGYDEVEGAFRIISTYSIYQDNT